MLAASVAAAAAGGSEGTATSAKNSRGFTMTPKAFAYQPQRARSMPDFRNVWSSASGLPGSGW